MMRSLLALVAFTVVNARSPTAIRRVVSSLDGLRLSEQENVHWLPGVYDTTKVTVVVDPHRTFQTVRGFGASLLESGAINLNSLPDAKQTELLDLLFSVDGARLSAMKAPMPSDDFFAAGPWYTYDDTPGDVALKDFSIERDLRQNGTLSFVLRAKQHGFDGYIQSYMDFPPDWMLKGELPHHATVDPAYYDVLAMYFARFVQAYADHNVTINYLSMFNEPIDSYTNISAPEMARLLGDHVGPLFDKLGLRPKTKLTSAGQATREWAHRTVPPVMADKVASKYMDHIAYHGYDCQFNCSKERQMYDKIADMHRRWPELEVWMTEVCYAYNGDDPNCASEATMINCTDWPRNHSLAPSLPRFGFDDGRIWGSRIASDLQAGVSGWIYWNLILDMSGGPYLTSPEHGDDGVNLQQAVVHIDPEKGDYQLTGLFWYLAHFSKFVRPGMVRVDTSVRGIQMPSGYVAEGTIGVEAVSFIDGNHVVVQLMNHDLEDRFVTVHFEEHSAKVALPAASITTASWDALEHAVV